VDKFFSAVIHRKEKIYLAKCLELGIVSRGYGRQEALANLQEASEPFLKEFSNVHVRQK